MRVLIVYPRMDLYGGAELLVVRLANYLSKRKIRNALLTTNILPEIERELTETQIMTHPFIPLKGALRPLNLFKTLWRLNEGVRKNFSSFDIVNVHNYPAELSIFPYRKPVVWMCNEPPEVHVKLYDKPKYSFRRFVIGAILAVDKHVVRHYVSTVVVADEFNKSRFRMIYGFDPHVVNYGIDCHFFAAHPKDNKRKNADRFTVLHVGMLTPLKNQLESLKTIEKLKSTIPGIKLILAGFGEGEYLHSLQEFIKAKKLEDHVEITGHISRERLKSLYHTSNVLLHPIKSQGGWLSPFEALCAQTPIIVSSEMTASSLIRKEVLGTVTNDFANAVLDIYQNPAQYEKMAIPRAEWVRDNLSWDSFCGNMLEVFSLALNQTVH